MEHGETRGLGGGGDDEVDRLRAAVEARRGMSDLGVAASSSRSAKKAGETPKKRTQALRFPLLPENQAGSLHRRSLSFWKLSGVEIADGRGAGEAVPRRGPRR